MNSLAQYIYSNGVDKLKNLTVVKSDSTLYTVKYLAKILTPEELAEAAAILKVASDSDPQMWLFVQSFTSSGIAFNEPLTQYIITTLFSNPSLRKKLLEIGIVQKYEWEAFADKEPTDDEIKAAQSQVDAVKLIESISQLRDQGLSLEEVKTQVQTLID